MVAGSAVVLRTIVVAGSGTGNRKSSWEEQCPVVRGAWRRGGAFTKEETTRAPSRTSGRRGAREGEENPWTTVEDVEGVGGEPPSGKNSPRNAESSPRMRESIFGVCALVPNCRWRTSRRIEKNFFNHYGSSYTTHRIPPPAPPTASPHNFDRLTANKIIPSRGLIDRTERQHRTVHPGPLRYTMDIRSMHPRSAGMLRSDQRTSFTTNNVLRSHKCRRGDGDFHKEPLARPISTERFSG